MLSLILVRHGETEWNKQHRYQGQVDIPLSTIGEQQAALVATRLSGQEIDIIYASDLKRAWQTATAIAKNKDLNILSEPRLREMNFGVLEGLTWDEAQVKHPEMVAAWLEDYNQPPEGGETLNAFSSRVLSFRDELMHQYSDKTILLVAHGGSLSELLRLVLGAPPEKRWSYAMDIASISELHLIGDGYPLLKKLNDICHLESLDV